MLKFDVTIVNPEVIEMKYDECHGNICKECGIYFDVCIKTQEARCVVYVLTEFMLKMPEH